MKKRYYIITGIIAYLGFLLVSIPAAPVLAQLQNYLPSISIQGISGSLWQGNAASITINQQHTLHNTDWQLNAWRLLTGEVNADINTHYQQEPISGNLGIRATGTVTAQNIRATMNAATVAELTRLPLAELAGTFALNVDQLKWQQQQVPRLNGILHWNSAAVTVAETAELGDVTVNITETDNQPLHASISNTGGQIKLEGNANVEDDGSYSLQLNMLPNQSASDNIRSSLELIAKPKSDGSYQLDNQGNLKQFGII